MPDPASDRIDTLADAFENAWRSGPTPSVHAYLEQVPEQERAALLRELILLELEYRWRTGQPIRVEELIASYPEFQPDHDTLLDLIALEYRVRQCHTRAGSVAEYLERFPACRDQLTTRFSASEANTFDFLAAPEQPDEMGRLGSYRVLQVLGKGNMGIVFLAHDPKLDRKVALKAMLLTLAADPSAKHRFLREARSAAKLKSEFIVTIYEVSESQGVPFLTMELLEGVPLDRYLQTHSRLPAAQVIQMGRDIASGLAVAHEKGIIHRDIKPANLWLEQTHAGRVKILDFGLARSKQDDANLTHASAIVGTPNFMAPEQARAGANVDSRADLFSLGCVLYRLCAGQAPFQADTVMEVLFASANAEPAPLTGVSPQLSRLIMQLLEKQPERRPTSAREVIERLSAMPATEAAPDDTLVIEPAPTDLPRPRRARRWILIGCIGVALLALFGGIVYFAPNQGGGNQIEDDPKPAPPIEKEIAKAVQNPVNHLAFHDPQEPLPAGAPLGIQVITPRPAPLKGIESWTIETRQHRGSIAHYTFDQTGKRLATASYDDNTIRIWDAQTGQLQRVVYPVDQYVFQLAWTPGSNTLTVASDQLRLYDPDTGRVVRTLSEEHVGRFAWSPDGTQMAIASNIQRDLELYEMNAGKWERVRRKIASEVWELAWSPSGKRLAIRDETSVKIFDTLNFQLVQSWAYPFGRTEFGSFSWAPDEQHLAGPEVWNVQTGKAITQWCADKGTAGATLTSCWIDAQTLMLVGLIQSQHQWLQINPITGARKKIVDLEHTHHDSGTRGAWLPQSKLFAKWMNSGDGTRHTLRSLEVRDWTGNLRYSLNPPGGTYVHSAVSPSGKHVAISSGNGFVRLLEPRTGKETASLSNYFDLRVLKWSTDDARLLIASTGDGPWGVYDIANGKFVAQSHDADITNAVDAELHSNGMLLMAWCDYPQVKVRTWDLRVNRWRDSKPAGPTWQVRDIGRFLSNTGTQMATYDPNVPGIGIWDLATGKELTRLDVVFPLKYADHEVKLVWSLDNTQLAMVLNSQDVWIWDMKLGKVTKTLKSEHLVQHLAWTQKSDALLLASRTEMQGEYYVTIWPLQERVARTFAYRAPHRHSINNVHWTSENLGIYVTRGNSLLVLDKNGIQQSRFDYFSVRGNNWWLISSPDGHCRAEKEPDLDMVYVVRDAKGQHVLTTDEFAQRHGWRNVPAKVEFTPALER